MVFQKEYINSVLSQSLKPLWLSTPNDFPSSISHFSSGEKNENEAFIQAQGNRIAKHFDKFSSLSMKLLPGSQKRWMRKTEKLVLQFFRQEAILGISTYLTQDTLSQVMTEFKEFLRTARRFAPELTFSDLGQAVRNYLVYAMFLEMHNKKQKCTPAIFGYSMLYPFTDNFIDSPKSPAQKQAYNKMIYDKIAGHPVTPVTEHEKKTCDLLTCIESVYSRQTNPEIYEGLALMLEAQQISLSQQFTEYQDKPSQLGKSSFLDWEERLDISLLKGGVSVLIDRYFADSDVTDEDIRFYLGFGFLLQLADDLQDITSDLQEGSQTLFTLADSPEEKGNLVNRLLNYTNRLFCSYSGPNPSFQAFIERSSVFLIIMSAQMSKEHFPTGYMEWWENCFPVHFEVLDQYLKDSALYPGNITEDKLIQGIDLYLYGYN